MKYFFNGSAFSVCFSRDDAEQFASRWPCSTVQGRGSFQFARNGDIIDVDGEAQDHDGPDWLAFAQDCCAYGMPKFVKDAKRRNGYQNEPH